MYCIHCGNQLPREAKFCSSCGKPTLEPDTQLTDDKQSHSTQGVEITDKQVTLAEEAKPAKLSGSTNIAKRSIAFAIDVWLLTFLVLMIARGFSDFLIVEYGLEPEWWAVFLAYISTIVFFHTISIAFYSTTIGKFMFGLKVVDFKTHEKPKLWQAFIRTVIYLLIGFWFFGAISNIIYIGETGASYSSYNNPVFGLVIPFVYFLLARGEKNQRALHDLVARTCVVEVGKSIPQIEDKKHLELSTNIEEKKEKKTGPNDWYTRKSPHEKAVFYIIVLMLVVPVAFVIMQSIWARIP